MTKRFALGIVAIISLIELVACSTKPAVHEMNGQLQSSQPSETLSSLDNNPLLAYPSDDSDQTYHPRHASDEFPRPRELEPQVKFWRNAYATWSRSQVAIHDKLHMNVVYEVLQLPDQGGESLTPYQKELIQERMSYWRSRLGDLEDKLSAGMKLRTDEQRLANEIAKQAGDRMAIYGAGQRLRYQRGLRERFKRGLAIGSRYERKFREIFHNAGLPEDLALLPHVESSFQANAHSSAGALGIWQFTAGAARIFMNGDDSAEARLDPITSTYGAARYLSSAYDKLGSWPLAITSYNHGIGGMQRAKGRFGHDFPSIVKNYDHPQFGFASRNYYAEFLAARDIANDPERFFPEGLSYEGRPYGNDASLVTDTISASVPEPKENLPALLAASETQTEPTEAVQGEAASSVDALPSTAPEPQQDPLYSSNTASEAQTEPAGEVLAAADALSATAPDQQQASFTPSNTASEAQTEPVGAVEVETGLDADTLSSSAPELQEIFSPSNVANEPPTEPANAHRTNTGSVAKTPVSPSPQPRNTQNSLNAVNTAKIESTKAAPPAPKQAAKVEPPKPAPSAPIKLASNSSSKVAPIDPKQSKSAPASKEKPIKPELGGAQRVVPQKAATNTREPKLMAKSSPPPVVASNKTERLAAETHSIPVKTSSKYRPK